MKLPVMMWIHGGGFQTGSGDTIIYGPDWFMEQDVVLVTINYRCGVMGFLCLNLPEAPGNVGLKDQVIRSLVNNSNIVDNTIFVISKLTYVISFIKI